MTREDRGEPDARFAVGAVDHDPPRPELLVRRHLLRAEHRRDRRAGRGESRDRVVAVELGTRVRDRGLALVVAVEPFVVREIARIASRPNTSHIARQKWSSAITASVR